MGILPPLLKAMPSIFVTAGGAEVVPADLEFLTQLLQRPGPMQPEPSLPPLQGAGNPHLVSRHVDAQHVCDPTA